MCEKKRGHMNIPETTRQRLFTHMGNKVDAFLSQIDTRLQKYIAIWQLTDISFLPAKTGTANLLFTCKSGIYGACVLKICSPGPEVETEINCLLAYEGSSYCKLWDYNLPDNILLLEQVIPGNQLWAISDYRERARLMASILKGLPVKYIEQGQFPTYLSWMEGTHQKLTDMGGMDDILFFLNAAIEIYAELKQRHHRICLLHGDLHQENILLNANGSYTIIDPKGVVDDPVMEPARFLMNELPCEAGKIRDAVAIMSPVIGISKRDILKSMFIDAALMHSWCMEEYFPTVEAFEAEKQNALKTCKFVYGLLRNN